MDEEGVVIEVRHRVHIRLYRRVVCEQQNMTRKSLRLEFGHHCVSAGLLKTVVKLGETNKTTCMLGAYVSYIRWFCDESIEISKYLFATMA